MGTEAPRSRLDNGNGGPFANRKRAGAGLIPTPALSLGSVAPSLSFPGAKGLPALGRY